jgi:glycosyltransferase involved in cell wall biosynthesis
MYLLSFKNTRKNVIYHVHGYELANAYTGHFSELLINLYKDMINKTVISSEELRYGSLPTLDTNYSVLTNAVLFEKSHEKMVQEGDYYVFVSFPSHNKRLDTIVSKFRQNQSEKLVVVGWTELDFGNIYGRELKISSNIVFKGLLDRDDTISYIENAIGLVANSDSEAMPLIVAEAILSKTPCYLGSTIGYQFYLSNFETVRPIEELFSNYPRASQIEESYEHAKVLFSEHTYEARLLEIISACK